MNIVLRIIAMIVAISGYILLINSTELGYEMFGLFASNKGLSGSSPSMHNILMKAYTDSYRIAGAILLGIGLYFSLKKEK